MLGWTTVGVPTLIILTMYSLPRPSWLPPHLQSSGACFEASQKQYLCSTVRVHEQASRYSAAWPTPDLSCFRDGPSIF